MENLIQKLSNFDFFKRKFKEEKYNNEQVMAVYFLQNDIN